MTPGPPGSPFTISCFALDEDRLLEQLYLEQAAWDATNPPPNPQYDWSNSDPYISFVELDREIIIAGLTLLFRFTANDTLPSLVTPPDLFADRLVAESPREEWSGGR